MNQSILPNFVIGFRNNEEGTYYKVIEISDSPKFIWVSQNHFLKTSPNSIEYIDSGTQMEAQRTIKPTQNSIQRPLLPTLNETKNYVASFFASPPFPTNIVSIDKNSKIADVLFGNQIKTSQIPLNELQLLYPDLVAKYFIDENQRNISD